MFQGSEGIAPSAAVVEAVATNEDTDPIRLEPPLNDVVDPDALDALCANESMNGVVTFPYCGYTVTVDADGAVSVEKREGEADLDVAESRSTAVSD